MDVIQQKYILKTKVFLVFFCLLQFFNCKNKDQISNAKVTYENGKAVQVDFSSNIDEDSIKIYLKGISKTPVLGEFISKNKEVTFIPVVPFSNDKTYEIRYKDETHQTFTISQSTDKVNPELLAIYPTKDTVPENLLKMYFVFSKPMQEVSSALDYIKVKDHQKNTEVPVFLELQTELWNKDHTQLTLWLDPGRIKTDLIPNKELGLPIVNGNAYTINISKEFKDANGNPLNQNYSKTIVVKERDSKSPVMNTWIVKTPEANTQNELIIDFKESLDFALALETVKILNADEKVMDGSFTLSDKESILKFQPISEWENGNYTITVDSKLEDLAGNNLNHPFDRDLNADNNQIIETEIKTIKFKIN